MLEYEITPEQGKAMFEQAVAITGIGFSYDLTYRNCDHVALSILESGGINLEKWHIPNASYKSAKTRAFLSQLFDHIKNL